MQQAASRDRFPRVVGVDALRGFAIMLYVCGVPLVIGLADVMPGSAATALRQQFSHERWHGLTYYDIGFPAYIMLMGAAIVFSLSKHLREGTPKRRIYAKTIQRTLVLLALGFLFNGGFSIPLSEMRFVGVLQRLAVCYFCGVAIYLQVPRLGRWLLLAAILLGYWAALALVPVPGFGAGDYSYEGNLVAYVDSIARPGKPYQGTWDPEGLLSTIPAVGTCLAGLLLGDWLQASRWKPQGNALAILISGMLLVNTGLLWGEWFPINKQMWTSSYVVATAGFCLLHLFVFYQVGDVWGVKKPLYPLELFGRNSIAVYVGNEFIDFPALARRLVGGDVAALLGPAAALVNALVAVGLILLILVWFDRKGIALRV